MITTSSGIQAGDGCPLDSASAAATGDVPRQNPEGRALGALIRSRRQELGLTLQGVATRAGCAKSYLSTIENGKGSLPSEGMLLRLERALELETGSLIQAARWEATPAPIRRHVQSLEGTQRAAAAQLRELLGQGTPGVSRLRQLIERLDPGGVSGGAMGGAETRGPAEAEGAPGARVIAAALPVEVPLINSVRAGYPTEFTDLGYPARVADEYVRTPDIKDPDAFAARVVGDSMFPEYREGDIVVFSPLRPVKSGMDCFVRLEPDHDSTFKRVYFEGEAGRERIRLQPLNPAYPAATLERERVAGLYAAVSVTRSLG